MTVLKPQNKPILVVGSIALDWLETPDGQKGEVIGGSATYFTLAACKLSPVHVVGIVGSDFPERGMTLFQKHAANLDDLQVLEGKTFLWGGRYHEDWENRTTLFTELGVFEQFQPRLSSANKKIKNIFLANIQPTLQLDVLNQIEEPDLVVCDTMNLWIETAHETLESVLERIDVLLVNDSESHLLTGETDPVTAAKKIKKMGPETVVVKLGKQGAILVTDSNVIRVGAFPVKIVKDPTGAGDSFAGGFVGGLASGLSKVEALVAGSSVASFCVEGFGTEGLEGITTNSIKHRSQMIKKLSLMS